MRRGAERGVAAYARQTTIGTPSTRMAFLESDVGRTDSGRRRGHPALADPDARQGICAPKLVPRASFSHIASSASSVSL